MVGSCRYAGKPQVALLGSPAYYDRFGLTAYRPGLRGTFAYPGPFDGT